MHRSILALIVLLAGISLHASARATDVDGPDCGRTITDFGDAPEGLPILGAFGGVIGHYPTCLSPGAPGTQELYCAPRSTPPGPTGFMRNVQDGHANYWLGCYNSATAMSGIDSETNGKVSAPFGTSFCSQVADDCLLGGGTNFGQDECDAGDGDAGVGVPQFLVGLCSAPIQNQMILYTANCGPPRQAYLNILVDFNMDGDWNDNMLCDIPGLPGTSLCAHEWAVKNAIIDLPSNCGSQYAPPFLLGPHEGPTWMRVSLTDEAVDDDFPWAGSANRPGQSYSGGETEDYLVRLLNGVPTLKSTWGQVKTLYR